jgi:hypothetical protein
LGSPCWILLAYGKGNWRTNLILGAVRVGHLPKPNKTQAVSNYDRTEVQWTAIFPGQKKRHLTQLCVISITTGAAVAL